MSSPTAAVLRGMAKLDKFWIVTDPTLTCELSEVVRETTASELARYVRGCAAANARDDEHMTVHTEAVSAYADAGDRIKRLVERLERVNGQAQDLRRDALKALSEKIEPGPTALWAALREKVTLTSIADFIRQDLEASPKEDIAGEALCEKLSTHLAR